MVAGRRGYLVGLDETVSLRETEAAVSCRLAGLPAALPRRVVAPVARRGPVRLVGAIVAPCRLPEGSDRCIILLEGWKDGGADGKLPSVGPEKK